MTTPHTPIQDTAYGLIPVWINPQTSGRSYLLILHQKGHWAFPKGHGEAGETELETATREVREETGLTDLDIRPDWRFEEYYQFTSPKGKAISKQVVYFLAIVANSPSTPPPIQVQWAEVANFRWCTYGEALDLITFPANKQVLRDCEARWLATKS